MKDFNPKEYRVMALRDCPVPSDMLVCETPEQAAAYWRLHIETHPYFNPECECFVVLLLNVRRKVKGHQLVAIGTQDAVLVHPREIYRLALITAAHSVLVMHNHPSGESSPSDADLRITRELIRAGQLLKLELLDHVIVGSGNFTSLRSDGHFCP